MVKDLEEITIHEVNRIGESLSEDLTTLQDNIKPEDKEIGEYIVLYNNMIKIHNKFVKETNSYLGDHIVKYYINKSTKDLTYTRVRKEKVGF